jgi:hypothetical protein
LQPYPGNSDQLLRKFLGSLKSDKTKSTWMNYIHAYMRFYRLYEEKDLLNDNDNDNNDNIKKKKHKNRNNNNNLVYRYDWLIGGDDDKNDVKTIQNKIIDFAMDKKEGGLGAKGIDNYLDPLRKFY